LEKTYGHSLPEYSEAAANCIGCLFGGSGSRAFQVEYSEPEEDFVENTFVQSDLNDAG